MNLRRLAGVSEAGPQDAPLLRVLGCKRESAAEIPSPTGVPGEPAFGSLGW